MAKGPSVVIIARHGARLDAADKTWHLTSPTPYDPPLTYGGWTQSRALGIRIASLLHSRELENEAGVKANSANADLANLEFSPLDAQAAKDVTERTGPRPKKKQRIIIHSSPYLRCIQTSTAIAAGINQFQPSTPTLKAPHPKERNGLHRSSPMSRVLGHDGGHRPSSSPTADQSLEVWPKEHYGPKKLTLRIDAFLGEWLSPDYFEDITPPPNSTFMLASAKADLLRRTDTVEVPHNANNNRGHFPGGWRGAVVSHGTSRPNTADDGPLRGLGSLAQALPMRERASSQGSAATHVSRTSRRNSSSSTHKPHSNIYNPPVPSYAVSPAEPIPRGYFTHAREACIDPDYQWDSMRPPVDWGNGGEYGDEWSTMHKRFRKGLAGMITWYKEHGAESPHDKIAGFTFREQHSQDSQQPHHSSDPIPVSENMEADDDDEEIVLILVTHGAGCNALLGAISNQPVLLDVGMASLSMAVRKEDHVRQTSMPTIRRPSVMMGIGLSDEFEMKLLASLDHLRPGVDPAKLPQPSSPGIIGLHSPSLEYRRRFGSPGGSNASPIDSPFQLPETYRSMNSSLGSMRRSSTTGVTRTASNAGLGTQSPLSMSSTGLWSANLRAPTLPENIPDGGHSPGHDMVLNFGTASKPPAKITNEDGAADQKEKQTENDDVPELPTGLGRSMSVTAQGLWAKKPVASGGLWGGSGSAVANNEFAERERGPKRRWTVTERD